MSAQSNSDDEVLSLIASGKPRGRLLFTTFAVIGAVLLLLARSQTETGDLGWWNEPINAPFVSLAILFVFSTLAAIYAEPEMDGSSFRRMGMSVVLAAGFFIAVLLIKQVGYGLSVLALCLYCGTIAGFRGWLLIKIAFGLTILSVLVFRYFLGLWFPRPALFELSPMLEVIGGYI